MKQKRIQELGMEILKTAGMAAAKHYANVSCPFFTYQPELPESVKNMRDSKNGR